MPTRPALALIYTLDLLAKRGVPCEDVLRRHGMERRHLAPDGEIGRDRELALLSELLPRAEDPRLGFEMGRRFGLAGYGSLTLLLMTSPTYFEAFRLGVRYQSLTYLYGELSLVPGDGETALILKPNPLPDGVRRILIDRDMAGTFRLVHDFQTHFGLPLTPREIWLPYAEPDRPTRLAYERFFRAPIRYDAPWCQALLPNRDLNRALPGHSPAAQAMYRAQCDARLARRARPTAELAPRVSAYLALFNAAFPGAIRTAAAFGLSERSFRRRLREEGHTFQALLDTVRLEKAKTWLADDRRSVESIATLLGYSEPAAFIRAFKRWTGETPSRYRRAL